MPRASKLTPEQWRAAKWRWEGSPQIGFEWLSREVQAAFGVVVIRASLKQAANLKGWEKGGPTSEQLRPGDDARGLPERGAAAPGKGHGHGRNGGNIPARLGNISAADEASEVVDAAAADGDAPPGERTAPAPAGRTAHPARRYPGAPTKYRDDLPRLIVEFFDKEPFTDLKVEQPNGLTKLQRMPTDPPMLATFAKSVGISMTTINRWAVQRDAETGNLRYPVFAEAYARARDLHEALLARAALMGVYDNRVSQFVLKNLYGWTEQPKVDQEVVPVSREELEATYIRDMDEAHARQDALDAERRRLLAAPEDA